MKSSAVCYQELRGYLQTLPIIDCHDHSSECGPKPTDAIHAVMDWYMRSDLHSAAGDHDIELIFDETLPLAQRWPVLEKAWRHTRFTGYAEVVRRALLEFYQEPTLSLAALERIQERMIDFSDPRAFESVLEKAGIVTRLEDAWLDTKKVFDHTAQLPPRSRMVISLPRYHTIQTYDQVQANASPLGRVITCLDEYLQTCRDIFTRLKEHGAVALKDQSAYSRSLNFLNPTYARAEEAFNWIMEDPRRSLAYPDDSQPLDDYLFHEFMRMARDLDLPVQIHTGHMAGIRNEVSKTNAVLLTSLINLHRETRFDLFHANWPYGGEILFLVKNYPNVRLDFCWAHMVDPIYTQALLRQAVSSVPHGKIHGYGSDLSGNSVTSAWAHADLARDNIAIALADLVAADYLDLEAAQEIARAWLFDNPNEFFRLNLT